MRGRQTSPNPPNEHRSRFVPYRVRLFHAYLLDEYMVVFRSPCLVSHARARQTAVWRIRPLPRTISGDRLSTRHRTFLQIGHFCRVRPFRRIGMSWFLSHLAVFVMFVRISSFSLAISDDYRCQPNNLVLFEVIRTGLEVTADISSLVDWQSRYALPCRSDLVFV